MDVSKLKSENLKQIEEGWVFWNHGILENYWTWYVEYLWLEDALGDNNIVLCIMQDAANENCDKSSSVNTLCFFESYLKLSKFFYVSFLIQDLQQNANMSSFFTLAQWECWVCSPITVLDTNPVLTQKPIKAMWSMLIGLSFYFPGLPFFQEPVHHVTGW